MRFLTAALAVGSGEYRVDGNERMRSRPIGPLLHALHELGLIGLERGEHRLSAGHRPRQRARSAACAVWRAD